MPSSSAPSTVSNSASSPAAWPSVRLQAPLLRPPAVAVHHAGRRGSGCGSGRCPRTPRRTRLRTTSRPCPRTLPPAVRIGPGARCTGVAVGDARSGPRHGDRRGRASTGAGRTVVAARSPAAARPAPGQARWPRPSAAAIAERRHLVVQAGTGTGKSLAYLVPAILSGRRDRRRHRHQGAAGPAGRQGPAVPRRAPRRAVRRGRC